MSALRTFDEAIRTTEMIKKAEQKGREDSTSNIAAGLLVALFFIVAIAFGLYSAAAWVWVCWNFFHWMTQ